MLERFDFSEIHMGGRVDITLYAADRPSGETAARAAFARFADLEAIMSDYRPDSELMKLCAKAGEGAQRLSPDLAVVFEKAQQVAERSGGAFDVTCGPLIQLWREARRTGRRPADADLERAKALIGWRKLILGVDGSPSATLENKGMRLDLGGIAKGYAADEAVEAMRALGIERALIQAGGDIVAAGAPPGKIGWKIAIRGGGEVYAKNQAVSTSGDAYQYVVIDGKRYSHIVDPRVGEPLTKSIQATVIAKDGITSDSLATALCVLGPEAGRALADSYGVDARFLVGK